MLNFIVLGQLPGTNVELTFRGVLLGALLVYSGFGIAYHLHLTNKLANPAQ